MLAAGGARLLPAEVAEKYPSGAFAHKAKSVRDRRRRRLLVPEPSACVVVTVAQPAMLDWLP